MHNTKLTIRQKEVLNVTTKYIENNGLVHWKRFVYKNE